MVIGLGNDRGIQTIVIIQPSNHHSRGWRDRIKGGKFRESGSNEKKEELGTLKY